MLINQLNEEGYAVISLLDESDLNRINGTYESLENKEETSGFYATMYHPDNHTKKKISKEIGEILEDKFRQVIPDYHYLFANFLVKAANSEGTVGIHQDWTYVDELNYTSYNIWGALTDTTPENGGLHILPKSHMFPNAFRGTPFQDGLYNENSDKIFDKSIFVPTKRGEVIIYDSRLIHFSHPNTTEEARIAFAGIVVPKWSKPIHYFNNEGSLQMYEVDETFFCELQPNLEPKIPFTREILEWWSPTSTDLSNFIDSL